MKYHITYRLMHPQYMPAISGSVVDAYSHADLDSKLSKIKTKWQARGYIVQITKVKQQKVAKKKHLQDG